MMAPETKEQVAVLHRISNIVSSSWTLEKILQELVDLAVAVSKCDACLVYLVDHSTNEIVLRASQLPHAKKIGNIRLTIGEGLAGWVGQHKSVVALASNIAADSRFKAFPALPEEIHEAFLSAPLISGGDLIGVINIHYRDEKTFTQEEIALAAFLGEQMGGAIAKSRLAQRLEMASRQMEALARLARTISDENYLDRMLEAVSEVVTQILDFPLCSIILVDQDGDGLATSAARCSSPHCSPRRPLRIEESLIARVLRAGQPMIIADVVEDRQYCYPDLAYRTDLASLLSVPILAREKVIGTVNAYTRVVHQFTEEEMGFVEMIAALAALAVQNTRLAAETREMKRMLNGRKLIDRARGILQQKYSLTEEEAYLRLRDESRDRRRPIRDLAEAVILAQNLERRNANP
jgi:GAF domain-containing protein